MNRGKRRITVLAAGLLILAAGVGLFQFWHMATPVMGELNETYTLMIDAGHGGEDGGAVSITGVSESEINLSIACKLEDLLALYGVQPIMLRREDISLHDAGAKTLREKKVSDLKNRVKRVEETETPFFISIHQNSYPEKKYHGPQVFYANTMGSEQLGQHIQAVLNEKLDSRNTRAAKQIPDSVYLMNHITCPAILVECGFLTNPEEEALLRTEEYQRKIAVCLTGGLLTTANGQI